MTDLFNVIATYRWVIAGTLIMASVGAYFVALNNRRNRFSIASEKFRGTILKEFKGLYPTPIKWPDNDELAPILDEKFTRLEIAVNEFRPFLGFISRIRFDRAWKNYQDSYYYYEPHDGNITLFNHHIKLPDTTKTYKDNFKNNVDDLLKFAKQYT